MGRLCGLWFLKEAKKVLLIIVCDYIEVIDSSTMNWTDLWNTLNIRGRKGVRDSAVIGFLRSFLVPDKLKGSDTKFEALPS